MTNYIFYIKIYIYILFKDNLLYILYIMTPNYNLDENKIKTLLDELNNDRDKYFADIKMSNKMEPLKESKIKALEVLIKNLLAYKKIIIKEKEDKEKDN